MNNDQNQVVRKALETAQTNIAAARDMCDEIERDQWDYYQRAIDALDAPASCQHEYHWFGDQVKSRRCLHCNKLESVQPASLPAKEVVGYVLPSVLERVQQQGTALGWLGKERVEGDGDVVALCRCDRATDVAQFTSKAEAPVKLTPGWVHDGDCALNPATGERVPYPGVIGKAEASSDAAQDGRNPWAEMRVAIPADVDAGFDRAMGLKTAEPPSNIDTAALSLAREIMKIVNGSWLPGGAVQVQAKIQCAVADALAGYAAPSAAPAQPQEPKE